MLKVLGSILAPHPKYKLARCLAYAYHVVPSSCPRLLLTWVHLGSLCSLISQPSGFVSPPNNPQFPAPKHPWAFAHVLCTCPPLPKIFVLPILHEEPQKPALPLPLLTLWSVSHACPHAWSFSGIINCCMTRSSVGGSGWVAFGLYGSFLGLLQHGASHSSENTSNDGRVRSFEIGSYMLPRSTGNL